MPVKHALWEVGTPPQRLMPTLLEAEKMLEEMIVADPAILSNDWMLIGQQVLTDRGPMDLLGIAPDGTLVVIELKRGRTPRDVVAQALDYAGWVEKLVSEQIADLYRRFSGGKSLRAEFKTRFGTDIEDDALNQSHQIVIVASTLDSGTERIVRYLNDRDVPINVLFFETFGYNGKQLLSRTWLIDPSVTQLNTASTSTSKGTDEPWNGEFYVSFGHGPERSWDEARRYGFICAGGGAWYTRTLNLLKTGNRIWVNIPATGYVGVGEVLGESTAANDFKIEQNGAPVSALEVLTDGHYHREFKDDPDQCEYFVPVRWLDDVPLREAYSETGLFGNQNSVCKPTAAKWRHTVERLKERFRNWNTRGEHQD